MDYGFPDNSYYFYNSGVQRHVTLWVRTSMYLQSTCGSSDLQFLLAVLGALCLICSAHCSEAIPFQEGHNQPSNSFPSGFKAWSWNSSLLAVIQHRAACSSSLAGNRVLCSCSHWFPFMLVKFSSVCFTETCTSRYVMKRSCRLDAKCVAVAGWGQFC